MPKNITAIKMRIPKCNPYANVYQIKITLLDIKPSVWRRILVPETFTFQNLHDAIQDVMGWDDCHLHCFSVKTNKLTRGLQIGSRAQLDDDVMEESTTLLNNVAKSQMKITYEYDFGDSWLHELVFEEILEKSDGTKYPLFVKGANPCPAEDSRGDYFEVEE